MRIVVAMTGATGAAYGVRLLAALAELGVERHLILSRWAEVTSHKETGMSVREIGALASVVQTLRLITRHSCKNSKRPTNRLPSSFPHLLCTTRRRSRQPSRRSHASLAVA